MPKGSISSTWRERSTPYRGEAAARSSHEGWSLLIAGLIQGGAAPWPASAIQDTVAAIVRDGGYQRSVTQSLMRRLWSWFTGVVSDFLELFRGSDAGRYVTIALLVLLVLLVIARIVIAARAGDADHAATAAAGVRLRDPWQDAHRFAAEGRFTDAAHALLAAILSAFAARGEIRLHTSKTAGDYARELRRRASSGEREFQAFRARYDRIIYGTGECSEDDYAALLHDAAPMLARDRAA